MCVCVYVCISRLSMGSINLSFGKSLVILYKILPNITYITMTAKYNINIVVY